MDLRCMSASLMNCTRFIARKKSPYWSSVTKSRKSSTSQTRCSSWSISFPLISQVIVANIFEYGQKSSFIFAETRRIATVVRYQVN